MNNKNSSYKDFDEEQSENNSEDLEKLQVELKAQKIHIAYGEKVTALTLEEWKDPNKVEGVAKSLGIEPKTLFLRVSETLSEIGEEQEEEKGKKKPKTVKKVCGNIGEEECFESVKYLGDDYFLVYDGKGFRLEKELLTIKGIILKPISSDKNTLPYEPYEFKSLEEVNEEVPSPEELNQRIQRTFRKFVDAEEKSIEIFTGCVMLTYHQHKLQTTPYLFLYGDTESGKSTVLSLFHYLCFRPLYGVTLPVADIYGYLEDAEEPGTILEDEAQGLDRDLDKSKIFKAGYKKGARVARTLLLTHGRKIVYYNAFCFKAVASEKIFKNKGLNERFIFIQMSKGSPQKELSDISEEDKEEIRKLRNQLLKWRMKTKFQLLPELNLQVRGRVKEIWRPLLQVIYGTTLYDRFEEYVIGEQSERIRRKQETLEGRIIEVVRKLIEERVKIIKDGKEDPLIVDFSSIWNRLLSELEGTEDLRNTNRADTPEFGLITKQFVGRRIADIFKITSIPVRENGVRKAYKFDFEKLNRLLASYGYEIIKLERGPERVEEPKTDEQLYKEWVEKHALVVTDIAFVTGFIEHIPKEGGDSPEKRHPEKLVSEGIFESGVSTYTPENRLNQLQNGLSVTGKKTSEKHCLEGFSPRSKPPSDSITDISVTGDHNLLNSTHGYKLSPPIYQKTKCTLCGKEYEGLWKQLVDSNGWGLKALCPDCFKLWLKHFGGGVEK
jgi:hypothetical protein